MLSCPEHPNTKLLKGRKGWFCEDCTRIVFPIDEGQRSVNLSQANSVDIRERCRELAGRLPWIPSVEDGWPAPIAHEIHRLRQLIGQGELVGSVWQLKDVAEVLIKTPAVVMASAVFELSGHEELRETVRRALLSKPLSMGGWTTLAGDTLAGPLCRSDLPWLATVASWWRTPGRARNPSETGVNSFLRQMVRWRNDELGHGAFRLDIPDFLNDVESLVKTLLDHLQAAGNPWKDLVLSASGEQTPLMGWSCLRNRREVADPLHNFGVIDLELISSQADATRLRLSPWLRLRRCQVCGKHDSFFFDSRVRTDNVVRLHFLDYLSGHKMALPRHFEPELADTSAALTPVSDRDGDLTEVAIRGSLIAQLEERYLEAEYVSPRYLREPLKKLVESRAKGMLWLRAPAHCGKTIFVNGLKLKSEKPLCPNLKIVTFHIRREYRYHLAQWKEVLGDKLRMELDLATGSRELPSLDLGTPQPKHAFTQWLGSLLQLHRKLIGPANTKLLVALDGLDELANAAGERTLLDFLPLPNQLPDGVFLLLTSRPLRSCPPWIPQRLDPELGNKFADSILEIDLQDPGYRALLREFFDERLRVKFTNEIMMAIQREPLLPPREKLNDALSGQLTLKAALNEALKGLPEKSQGGRPGRFLERVVYPIAKKYEKGFELTLGRAEGCFRFVSHICNLLRDTTLELGEVEMLPSGVALFEHYLDQLQESVSEKQFEWMRRILFILVAAGEAQVHDAEMHVASGMSIENPEVGIPLSVLATLLGEANPGAARFVFALASLKDVLRVDRHDEQRRGLYRLGLKGLREVVKSKWPEGVRRTHRTVIDLACQNELERSNDEVAIYSLRYFLAHLDLCRDTSFAETVIRDSGSRIREAFLRQHSEDRKMATLGRAARWATCEIVLLQRASLDHEEQQRDLASTYANRGIVRMDAGDHIGARGDYDRAISLYEGIGGQSAAGQEGSVNWRVNLATCYTGRSDLRKRTGDLDGAVADCSRSIQLMEDLRRDSQQSDHKWTTDFQEVLGCAYMNRGNAFERADDLIRAERDFTVAIDLMEGIRTFLTAHNPECPKELLHNIARGYENRAAVRSQAGVASGAEDLKMAIQLLEAMRADAAKTGQAWLPVSRYDLAMSYSNQGDTFYSSDDFENAITSHKNAIDLIQGLATELAATGHGISFPWKSGRVRIFVNLGSARLKSGDLEGGERDICEAIRLGEELWEDILAARQEFIPEWQFYLSLAFKNRGAIQRRRREFSLAELDYTKAIRIMEGIRENLESLGSVMRPTWKHDLANTYFFRGDVRTHLTGRESAAVDDFGRAIDLMEGLAANIDALPRSWAWKYKGELSNMFDFRASARQLMGDQHAAEEDRRRAKLLLMQQFLPSFQA